MEWGLVRVVAPQSNAPRWARPLQSLEEARLSSRVWSFNPDFALLAPSRRRSDVAGTTKWIGEPQRQEARVQPPCPSRALQRCGQTFGRLPSEGRCSDDPFSFPAFPPETQLCTGRLLHAATGHTVSRKDNPGLVKAGGRGGMRGVSGVT